MSEVSVRVGRVEEEDEEEVVDVLIEMTPPFPFDELHEVNVDEVSVRDEVMSINSITDPFPSFRVILSMIPRVMILSVAEEEREMSGEERRLMLDI